MLIDRILANLGVEVSPFATCGVAPGWRLRFEADALVTLHFILRGEGALRDRHGAVTPLPLHSLVVVPPDQSHAIEVGSGTLAEGRPSDGVAEPGMARLRAGPASEEELLVACGHVLATWGGSVNLFGGLDRPLVVGFGDTPHMRAVFEAILAEQKIAAPGRMQMLSALMHQCLVGLLRRLCEQEDCVLPWLAALEDGRVARAMQRVLEAPEAPHSLDSLAREAAMSRSAFAARFRAALGRTPMEYVKDVRLREAARLLRQGHLTVDAVAVRAGFASRSHFSRAFREALGQSPSAWRATAPGPRGRDS